MRDLNKNRGSVIRATQLPPVKTSLNKTQRVIKKYHKPSYLNVMSEAEKEANIKVLQSMSKRLNYLKNPRYKDNKSPILISTVILFNNIEHIQHH